MIELSHFRNKNQAIQEAKKESNKFLSLQSKEDEEFPLFMNYKKRRKNLPNNEGNQENKNTKHDSNAINDLFSRVKNNAARLIGITKNLIFIKKSV